MKIVPSAHWLCNLQSSGSCSHIWPGIVRYDAHLLRNTLARCSESRSPGRNTCDHQHFSQHLHRQRTTHSVLKYSSIFYKSIWHILELVMSRRQWEVSRWESGAQEGGASGQCGPYWQTSDTAACSPRQLQIRTVFCIFYQRRDREKRTRLADQLDRRNLTEYYGWRINLLSNFVQKICFNHYRGLHNKPEPVKIL